METKHQSHLHLAWSEARLARIWVLAVWCVLACGLGVRTERVSAEAADIDQSVSSKAGTHWAFVPPRQPALPMVKDSHWPRTPVDFFVLEALERKGLRPAGEASRETFIRRATLDLLGLPPTPPEIEAFVGDSRPGAVERLVDRLLASPHYGERWGRHWLDVARYADSGGFETDLFFGHAWRFRDYVIRAFNADKPFDRFLKEQIAGDELFPGDQEALLGTGFFTVGPVLQEAGMVAGKLEYDQLTDAVDTAGSAFMGLTLGCARCHDHKYDPISQKDYFGLQAVFAASDQFDFSESGAKLGGRAALRNTLGEFEFEQLRLRARRESDPLKRANLLRQAGERVIRKDKALNERWERSKRFHAAKERGEAAVAKPDDLIADMAAFAQEVGKTNLSAEAETPIRVLGHLKEPWEVRLLRRGELEHPGAEVAPALPAALAGLGGTELGRHSKDRRRAALAEWLASGQHPLTARVIVNRAWHWHFGRGLVSTPDDFGVRGERPSHPELLDWLAVEFVRQGWSLKRLHRWIVLSSTYRMDSRIGADQAERDPENRWFTRFQPRRLEAEVIWDGLRAVAGSLNLEMHGLSSAPPLDDQEQIGNFLKWPESTPAESNRRAVYLLIRRSFRFPMLSAFDLPDNISSRGQRDITTVPNQALALLNHRTIQDQASAFAARLLRETNGDWERIPGLAWRYVYGRAIDADERAQARRFMESRGAGGGDGSPEKPGLHAAVKALCLALFNTNEFIYAQ